MTRDDDDGILKVDRLGRVQTPPERREALLDEFEKSGMSGKAFAERFGIKYQTFCSWRQGRRKAREEGGETGKDTERYTLALAELPKAEEAARAPVAPLAIELAGGHRLLVSDRSGVALAAELIAELARARC